MNNLTKLIRRGSTILLPITVLIQIVSVILMETGFESHDIEELHELSGFTFFGLVVVHIIIFRKSLKNFIKTKA